MGIQIVPYQDYPLGIGVIDIQKRLDRFGQINRRFGGTYTDLTSSAQRFGDHKVTEVCI